MSQYLYLRNITKFHLLISMLHFLKNLIESRIDAINNPIKKPIQTPVALSSVYNPRYIINGIPKTT